MCDEESDMEQEERRQNRRGYVIMGIIALVLLFSLYKELVDEIDKETGE